MASLFTNSFCNTRFYVFVLLLQALSLANLLLGLGLALGLAQLQNQLNDQLANNNGQPTMNMNITMPAVAPTTPSNTGPGTNRPMGQTIFPPGTVFNGTGFGLFGFGGQLTVPQAAALAQSMADMRRNMDSLRADMRRWEDKIRGYRGNGHFDRFCHQVSSYLDYCKGSRKVK